MSVSVLFQPNSYNLYAGSFTTPNITTNFMISQIILTSSIILSTNNSSSLKYYEEYSQNVTWSGIYDYESPNGLLITQIGRIVTCKIKSHVQKLQNKSVLIIGPLPARFRPINVVVHRPIIINSDRYHDGLMIISPDGFIIISPGINPTNKFSKINVNAGIPFDIELFWQISNQQSE